MRAIWKGALGFGLVNIPVSLYLAAQSGRTSFHLLHKADDGRIRYKRVCELDGEEVEPDEIVRGYEYAKGAYVEVSNEDLDRIDIGLPHTVEIVQFVEDGAIDPSFYERPYFIEPGKGAERAYALLREALVRAGKVGIGRLVFRDRESLAVVRPRGDALVLNTLRFASELRDMGSLDLPAEGQAEPAADQLELALLLIERLSAPWEPERYRDRYEEAVQRMIQRKLEGLPAPEAPPLPTGVIDLAEVLRQSLGEAEKERPEAGSLEAPREKEAARTSRRRRSAKKR